MKATLLEMELHRGIKAKDDISFSKLFMMYHAQIGRSLSRRYPTINTRDESLIETAVIDAFISYNNNPDSYNPEKATLMSFIKMAAYGDLMNSLKREKKHGNRKDLPESVELEEKFWNTIMKSSASADSTIVTDELLKAVQDILQNYFTNDTDITLAKMILANETKTEYYSEVLEIEDLEIEEQRREVKKYKDRIKQVLKRHDIESKIKKLFL